MSPPEKSGVLRSFGSSSQDEDKRNGNDTGNKQTDC